MVKECTICDAVKIYKDKGFSKDEAVELATKQFSQIEQYSDERQKFISAKISKCMDEGDKPHDQCVAIAHQMWRDRNKKK
jgi:hypothetical protein